MLGVRTTQASLQFIILWERDQLPRRQLSIARDPDIKPHSDCCMKKHYHLAPNLIMLREQGTWEQERDSWCHQNIYEGGINQMCHASTPNASLPRSKSGGASDCVINLIFYFHCQLHNVQRLIRPAQQMQTNLKAHYGDNQSAWRRVNSGTSHLNASVSNGARLYHCQSAGWSRVWHIRSSAVTHGLYSRVSISKRAVTQLVLFRLYVRILVHQ